MSTKAMTALLRLELADARRSRWVGFTMFVYAGVFTLFVALGLRESSVLGFTGLSRVVLNVANAVLVAVPLVSLVATAQAVTRARETGAFELLLSQPCRRGDWFFAFVTSRLLVLLGPLALLLGGTLAAGAVLHDGGQLLSLAGRCLAISAALVWSFVAAGTLLSTLAPSSERAIVYALVAWLACAALHDFALIGALLRWNVPPRIVFALAAVNPIEMARLGILSGIDPDLSVFGPVGFWLATNAGPRLMLLASIVWPVVAGGALFAVARHRLQRADLI